MENYKRKSRASNSNYPIVRCQTLPSNQQQNIDFIEKDLTRKIPSDQKYAFEQRGQTTVRQYSQKFALTYYNRMGDMVESRLRKAIIMVGSLWYTAWVDAGQPDLSTLGQKISKEELEEQEKELQKSIEGQEIKGREHQH